MTDRFTLPCFPSLIKKLKEDQNGLTFWTSVYVELLSQFGGPYADVRQELRMMHGEIKKLANELVTLA